MKMLKIDIQRILKINPKNRLLNIQIKEKETFESFFHKQKGRMLLFLPNT